MINIFKKKKLKTYKSCKTLLMYNFYEILDSEDYRWLVTDYNENSELILTDKEQIELSDLWKEIFNEYIELKGDQSIINNLRKRAIIAKLQNRLFWGATLLNLIIKNPTTKNLDKIIDELDTYQFKINKDNDLSKEIEKIAKKLKSLKTRLNIEISKYESKLEVNSKKEKSNIDSQIINIGKILDLKYKISSKETTVSEWLSYCENAKKVIENGRKD